MADYRKLQDMNDKIQSGNLVEPQDDFRNALAGALSNKRNVQEDVSQMALEQGLRIDDKTIPAIEAGYGTRRIDRNVNIDEFMEDPEDARSRAQTGLGQILNGTAKMATTSVITFVDDIAGTVIGLGNVAKDAVDGDGFHPMDSFINNGLSSSLDDLREWFETVFPNYRTQEERNDVWWNHINANFIGDTLLKNLGFTIGSGAAMALTGAGIGKLASKGLAPDIIKGAMAAAKGDASAAKSMDVLANMFKSGNIEASKIVSNARNAAKRLVYAPATTQFASAVLGSIGEARMEALGAAKELAEELTGFASQAYDQKVGEIDDMILSEHPELMSEYDYAPSYDENGNYSLKLQAFGPNALAMRDALIQKYGKEYEDNIDFIDGQSQNAAAGVFLANLPVLTLSSMFQFGKLLSGGYKNAVVKNSVKGGLEIGKDGTVKAAYKTGLGVGAKTAFGSAKNALSEGGEELMQKFISETEKYKGRKHLAAFNNDAFDDDEIDAFGENISALFETMKEQVKDPDTWQEFTVGALTGLLGLPGIKTTTDANGKKHRRLSLSEWNGGFLGERNDNKKRNAVVSEAVKAMNDTVNSKEFIDNWHSIIRHSLYGRQAEEAAAKKDEFAWHTADDKMLVNDVLMFARNGRIDDLLDIVDSFSRIDEGDIDDIKPLIVAAGENDAAYINMSNAEIADPIRRRAEQIKAVIKDYKKGFNDLVIRRPEISDEFASEILFTEMQMVRFEARYNDIAKEQKEKLSGAIDGLKAFKTVGDNGKEETITDEERVNKKKEVLRGHLDSLFGYNVNSWNQTTKVISDALLHSYADELSELVSDPSDKQKIKDLAKLSISRSTFYNRLRTLEDAKQEDFDGQAETHETHNEKRRSSRVEEIAGEAHTPEQVKETIKVSETVQSPEKSRETLQKASELNPDMDKQLTKRKYFNQIKSNIVRDDGNIADMADRMLDFVYDNDIDIEDLADSYITDEQNRLMALSFNPNFDAGNESDVVAWNELYNRLRALIVEATAKTNADNAVTGSKEGIPASKERVNRFGISEEEIAAIQQGSIQSLFGSVGTDGVVAPNPAVEKVEIPFAPRKKSNEKVDGELLSLEVDSKSITEDDTMDDQKAVAAEQLAEREELNIELGVDVDDESNDNHDARLPFFQPAFDQFAIDDMRAARKGLIVDLVPFGESSPEYADIYNALANRGAFEYINEGNISKGDDIFFVIDPSFPKYEDKENNVRIAPILMMHRKDGVNQIVGIVPSESRTKYAGLNGFYDAFDAEYDEFHADENNRDKLFVFSKPTVVKAVRQGVRSFIHEKEGDKLLDDKPISQCRDYEHMKNSPILFRYPGDKKPMTLLGVASGSATDNSVIGKVSQYSNFMAKTDGGIYLLAKNANGYYSPVRLSVERYNEQTQDGSYLDNRVKSILRKFFETGADGMVNIMSESGRKSVRDELNAFLRCDNLMFNFVSVDGSPEVRINEVTRDEDNVSRSKIVARLEYALGNDDMLVKAMANVIKSGNRPINVRPGISRENLIGLMDNGLIKSNVQYLSNVGATFYTNPFNEDANDFSIPEEKKPETINVEVDNVYTDAIEGADEYESTGDAESFDFEELNYDESEFGPYEGDDESLNYDDIEHASPSFDDLDKETRGYLGAKGYTKERFDAMSDALKEQAIECASI